MSLWPLRDEDTEEGQDGTDIFTSSVCANQKLMPSQASLSLLSKTWREPNIELQMGVVD